MAGAGVGPLSPHRKARVRIRIVLFAWLAGAALLTTLAPDEASAQDTGGLTASLPDPLNVDQLTVNLSWDPITTQSYPGRAGAAVQRRVFETSEYEIIVNRSTNNINPRLVTSYVDTGLMGSTAYQYRFVFFSFNPANFFDPVSITTPPAAPTGVAVDTTGGAVTLSWDNPNDSAITGYRIYRRVMDTGNYAALPATLGAATFTHADFTGAVGTSYQYRVQALNASVGSSPRLRPCAYWSLTAAWR